jgi:hypothetical protein
VAQHEEVYHAHLTVVSTAPLRANDTWSPNPSFQVFEVASAFLGTPCHHNTDKLTDEPLFFHSQLENGGKVEDTPIKQSADALQYCKTAFLEDRRGE